MTCHVGSGLILHSWEEVLWPFLDAWDSVRLRTASTQWNVPRVVIRLHGSGDTIALFLHDWEVAKVALTCHIALDMLCQEMHEVERRRTWFGF